MAQQTLLAGKRALVTGGVVAASAPRSCANWQRRVRQWRSTTWLMRLRPRRLNTARLT
jgi:hypothetical protein